jgi:KRAB domain-containing zinc finger protein
MKNLYFYGLFFVLLNTVHPLQGSSDYLYSNEGTRNFRSSNSSFIDETIGAFKTKETSPVTFKCDQCAKTFQSQDALYEHQRVHQTNKSPVCVICYKTFRDPESLRAHMHSVHAKQKPFQCSLCTATFKEQRGLERHRRNAHRAKYFKCDQCPSIFKTKPGLENHVKSAHADDDKPFKCEYCPMTFRVREEKEQHEKDHSQWN